MPCVYLLLLTMTRSIDGDSELSDIRKHSTYHICLSCFFNIDGCLLKNHLYIFSLQIKMFRVVILNNIRKKLVVRSEWCQIIDKDRAIIFHSANKNAIPQFDNVCLNFHSKEDRCYYGRILKECSEFLFIFYLFPIF